MSRRLLFVTLSALPMLACADDLAGPAAESAVDPSAEASSDARAARRLSNNRLSNNRLSNNRLSNNALTANPDSLGAISGVPLSTEGLNGNDTLRIALVDADAREVMEYVANCALGGEQSFTWYSPYDASSQTFTGAIGLCREWSDGAPSLDCLELVSACVISRVNALDLHVLLSLRGEPAEALAPGPLVPVSDKDRKGDVMDSFKVCAPAGEGDRNCGWMGDYVGTCLAGSTVVVGAGATVGADPCGAPLGASAGDTMLRVCAGARGCDAGSASFLAFDDDTCGLKPAVTFTCPPVGSFSVMVASYSSAIEVISSPAASGPIPVGPGGGCRPGEASSETGCTVMPGFPALDGNLFNVPVFVPVDGLSVDREVIDFMETPEGIYEAPMPVAPGYGGALDSVDLLPSWSMVVYPATEQQVFPVREAAFYGNIFDPAGLNPGLNVRVLGPNSIEGKNAEITGPIFARMWVCTSDEWSTALAYMNDRLCGGTTVTDGCAATLVGACGWREVPGLPSARCAIDDGYQLIGDGDYQYCLDAGGTPWAHPITVFLADRCEAAPDSCL